MRAAGTPPSHVAGRGQDGGLQLHRGVVQSRPSPFWHPLSIPNRLRDADAQGDQNDLSDKPSTKPGQLQMDGERLAQLLRLRIGIKPQGVHRCGSHRFQREPRRAERAFVGVELHQIGDAWLLAGHIGRKLTRDPAPERLHFRRENRNQRRTLCYTKARSGEVRMWGSEFTYTHITSLLAPPVLRLARLTLPVGTFEFANSIRPFSSTRPANMASMQRVTNAEHAI